MQTWARRHGSIQPWTPGHRMVPFSSGSHVAEELGRARVTPTRVMTPQNPETGFHELGQVSTRFPPGASRLFSIVGSPRVCKPAARLLTGLPEPLREDRVTL